MSSFLGSTAWFLFPLFMLLSTTNLTPTSLDFRAFPLIKMCVTLYSIFLSKCTLFPPWLLFSSCIPLTVCVVLPWLLFCLPPACCHVHFLMPIPRFCPGLWNSSVLWDGIASRMANNLLGGPGCYVGVCSPGTCHVGSSAEACLAWIALLVVTWLPASPPYLPGSTQSVIHTQP